MKASSYISFLILLGVVLLIAIIVTTKNSILWKNLTEVWKNSTEVWENSTEAWEKFKVRNYSIKFFK